MELVDKDNEVIIEFEEPISRQDYCDFYFHYDELEEVNDKLNMMKIKKIKIVNYLIT